MTAPPAERLALAHVLRGTGREFESQVQGVSMRGSLPAGSRIRIRCDGAAGAARGDVVAFVQGDLLVAHRLVGRGRGPRAANFLVTLGDGGVICDPPVAIETVLGTVIACQRGGEWVPVPASLARHGWRRPAERLLTAGVALALELDARLARALVDVALFAQRVKGSSS